MNTNKTARTAGFLYLLLVPFGFFGGEYILSITVPGNAVATVSNIIAHTMLFRLSILSALITPIVTVLVALFLYKLFKSVNKNQAVLMVVFALAALPIAMLNELNHFAVLLLLNGTDYLKVFSVDQLYSQVMFFLDLSHYGAFIAAIFWGLWLLPMGYLVFKSGFLPRIIGVLLIIAGFGYIIDAAALFLLPDLNIDISQFTFIGELLLLLWLLIKGVNVEQWKKRALESA
jgi:Domain of unknown function (DUF4386)